MSTIKVTNIQDTSGNNSSTSAEIFNGRAKAWVNFNGTGTVAIRADFNVNTITDANTGDYTVNFSNALADANYAVLYTGGYEPGVDARTCNIINSDIAQTTSLVRLRTIKVDATAIDTDRCNAAIFR